MANTPAFGADKSVSSVRVGPYHVAHCKATPIHTVESHFIWQQTHTWCDSIFVHVVAPVACLRHQGLQTHQFVRPSARTRGHRSAVFLLVANWK